MEKNKKGKEHGFGLKSIEQIAKKHGGRVNFNKTNNEFTSFVVMNNNTLV